ncbi:restriction endonuclease subunit S [Romboutsia timonensis]|uniref:restriction endonuclease subunit S n=1 Tax=Romboutsia timonensis TaxID=1776391 RepID=UPI003990B44C
MSCNELDLVKIGDICDVGSSKRIYASDYTESGIPFYRSKEVIELATNQEIINELFISKDKFNQLDEKFGSPKNGDILLASIGANMGIPYYVNTNYKFYFKDGNVTWFKNFKNNVNSKYIYYWIKSPLTQQKFINIAIGSAQKALTIDSLKKLDIYLPPLEEQEKIANILSSLDDKIELNNEMNKTLEEMAQSIFKRWFVDFEFPNEDGEPYKSSGGEMVDSELGMIPKGWEVKKISELIEVKDGTHASPKVSKEGFPLVTSKHIKGDRIAIEDAKIISEKDYLEVNKRSKVDTGDILISMIGTVGLTYFVQEEEINFAIKNIGLFKTSQNKTLSEYFYLYLKSDNMKNYIEARLAGTTQKYISLGELRNIPVVLPNDSIIDKFKKVVGVLLDKRRLNIINNEELMITRDTLLPKLMNGEIMI